MPEVEILPFVGIAVLFGAQLIGFSFWLGSLSQSIKELKNDLSHIQKDMKYTADRLDDINTRLSYLEGGFDVTKKE